MTVSYVIVTNDHMWDGFCWFDATTPTAMKRVARWSSLEGASLALSRLGAGNKLGREVTIAKYVTVRGKR